MEMMKNNLNMNRPEAASHDVDLLATVYREELVRCIARAMPNDGIIEPLKGLHLARVSSTAAISHGVACPSFCVIAQAGRS